MGAVTVKTNCGRSVSEEVRGGRFAFSTDRDSPGRERGRLLMAISLAFHFVEGMGSSSIHFLPNSMISGVKYRVTG